MHRLAALALLVVFVLSLAPTARASGEILTLTTDGQGRVDVDWKDADFADAMRLLGKVGRVNVVVDAAAQGKTITLAMQDVAWGDAVWAACGLHGFAPVLEGNVMRVAPTAKLTQEAVLAQQAADAAFENAPLSTIAVPLSWTAARDAEAIVSRQLSHRGSTMIDERTNTLFITDAFDGAGVPSGVRTVSLAEDDRRLPFIARLLGEPPRAVTEIRAVTELPAIATEPARAWRLLLAEGSPAPLPDAPLSIGLARDGDRLVLVVKAGRVGTHVPAGAPAALAVRGPGGEALLLLEPEPPVN